MPKMMRYNLTTAVAVAALTFGIAGPRLAPDQVAPVLSESDIVVAMDDTAATDEDSDSVKMEKDAATETGAAEETSDTDTKKVDQPERQDGTMEGAGEESQ